MHNHYVPQFLLKAWAEIATDRRVETFRLDLPGIPSSRRSPRGTAYEVDLYSLTRENVRGMEKHAIEKLLLKRIDGDAARIKSQILVSGPGALSEKDCLSWAMFLSSLRLRQPELVNDLKIQAAQQLRENLRSWQSNFNRLAPKNFPATTEEWTEQHFPGLIENFGLSFFAELVGNRGIIQAILGLDWWIWDAKNAGRNLVLSDNPCIFTEGIYGQNLVIVLPLSPTKAFFAARNKGIIIKLQSQRSRDLAIRINESSLNQARTRLYADSATVRRFIINRLRLNDRLPR